MTNKGNFDFEDFEVSAKKKVKSGTEQSKEEKKGGDDIGFAPPPVISCMLPILTVASIIVFVIIMNNMWMKGLARNTIVPDVAGMKVELAEKNIRAASLVPDVSSEWQYSEDVTEGVVISTFPRGKRHVKTGRKVHILVSKGSGITKVPDLTGMSLSEATDKLKNAGLIVGEVIDEFSKTVQMDSVISSDPPFDTEIKKDTKVNITISKGDEDGNNNMNPDLGIPNSSKSNSSISDSSYKIDLTLPNTDGMKADDMVITVNDKNGLRTEYEGLHNPGEKIVYNVDIEGHGTITVTFAGKKILQKKF